MKIIDIRIKGDSLTFLKASVGKTMKCVYHDPFSFTNSSSQAVKIELDDMQYFLYSFTEEMDYYGSEEEVAVWSVEDKEYPLIKSKSFITFPINETIKGITLINENQCLYDHDEQIYDVYLTRGIIFDLGSHQIAFEKAVWFSEDIIIHKGYNLVDKFAPCELFGNGAWEANISGKCKRESITITG